MKKFFLIFLWLSHLAADLPLYYWQQSHMVNFGDYLSLKLVERMVSSPVRTYRRDTKHPEQKLLAIGSILSFAAEGDVVWGTGLNGKLPELKHYPFIRLDVRSVRGPITRQFLIDNFGIHVPEVYGDPALLFPLLFPEFEKSRFPRYDYIIIPHYSELKLFPKSENGNIVYPTDPWDEVVQKILDSHLVISSSLHGIIIAEAYGIPARLLKISEKEPLLKYSDYYLGTGRPDFKYASSVEEALEMGGEPPYECDLKMLYESFPFEFWPEGTIKKWIEL